MSATPNVPADDLITIEIDGREYRTEKGRMIIEVTDAHGIDVPRFCYHKKLPIAANCRMCLVEVEKAPKPLPACATPVMDGMKIRTESDYARNAQKAVMEFLLINHPLDCPICDQGGECELQDLALGYGRDVSRFAEKKRVVADKNFGSLIASDMTRCIHCTRCVRFMEHIAGQPELGGMGRGERVEIGTYIERNLESELSGNIIDVCPVGALTSKPFRFRARAWEMGQCPSVSPHDCIGSNLQLHSRRGQLMRVVPRENEAVNEVWISDRDRFSYQGLYAPDRVQVPMLKSQGQWREASWDEALQFAAGGLRKLGGDDLGVLASPSATLEELHLLARLCEAQGWHNRDHRLRQQDFTNQEGAPLYPGLGSSVEALEQHDAFLVIGSNPRKDQPIAGLRIRKAAQQGARVMFLNPVDYDVTFPVAHKRIVPPGQMVRELAGVARCLNGTVPAALQGLVEGVQCATHHQAMVNVLKEAKRPRLLLGLTALHHPAFSALQALAQYIAGETGAELGYLTDGANSAGAWLAGLVPHRTAGAAQAGKVGLHARAMLEQARRAYLLLNVEPEFDCADSHAALKAMEQADFVIALGLYANENTLHYADVILPIAGFAETSGTYVNAAGDWQSFPGASTPPGEARPAWKVLRVLGNLMECEGFDYQSSEQVRDELRARLGDYKASTHWQSGAVAEAANPSLERIGDLSPYGVDALVRRASALQQTADGADARARLAPEQARALGLAEDDTALVSQGKAHVLIKVALDERVPMGAVWLPAARPASVGLGLSFGALEMEKA
ncbi:MAG: NADH-quinone oxidoreductase subunit NuoG [Gammaproteobacteria bacterium]|nr:NADH-quinone oxidoreductase subunit NuoG [Gammaproteobacteria bacterium]